MTTRKWMVIVVIIGLVMGGIQIMRRRGHLLVLARQHAQMEAAFKRLKDTTTSLLASNALAIDLLTTDRPANNPKTIPSINLATLRDERQTKLGGAKTLRRRIKQSPTMQGWLTNISTPHVTPGSQSTPIRRLPHRKA
jgi:hypothetical protein